jgi:hypothetical protein
MKDKIKHMTDKLQGIISPMWARIYQSRSNNDPVNMITEFIDNFMDQLAKGATMICIDIVNPSGIKKLVHPDTNIIVHDNGPGLPTDGDGLPLFFKYMHTHGGNMSESATGQATSKFGVGSKMAAYSMASQIVIVSKSKGSPAYVSFCDYKELGKQDGDTESSKCFTWQQDYYANNDRPPTLREMIDDKKFPSKSIKKSAKTHFAVFLNEDHSGLGYILGDTSYCGWDDGEVNNFWDTFRKTGIDTALRSMKNPLDNPVFTPLTERYIRQEYQDFKIFVGEDEVMVPTIDNYYKVYYNKKEKKYDIASEKHWREEPEFNFSGNVEVARDSENEVPSGEVEHMQPALVKIRKTKKEIPKEILGNLLSKGGIAVARRGSIIVKDFRPTSPKNVRDPAGKFRSLWALAKERASGFSVLISHECTISSDTCWSVTPDKRLKESRGCTSEFFATGFLEKLMPAEKLINDAYEKEDKEDFGRSKDMDVISNFFSGCMRDKFGSENNNDNPPVRTKKSGIGQGTNPSSHDNLPQNPIRGMSLCFDYDDKSPPLPFEWVESASGKSKILTVKTRHSTCRSRRVSKDSGTTAYYISEVIARKLHPKDQESIDETINEMMDNFHKHFQNKKEIV